ncbi:MAG: prepilin-type N-terminal cleavage/methylation domain-containing protein [Granulosicoccus sp.]|nr:prepilin-type N-terminal cleavage/methylation domain-containing protein [Granulosicoccus sp.]
MVRMYLIKNFGRRHHQELLLPEMGGGGTRGMLRQHGFTLVELAIVMIIVGLILSGVFKGQSLIDNARVRSISTEISGIRTAWYSFQERYRSLPGDFQNASVQIDSAAAPGNGNGRIDDSLERAGVWQQLSLTGLIKGSYDGSQSSIGSAEDLECSPQTCPQNPFNGFYKISYGAQAVGVDSPAHEIYTGAQIPVNILSQLDIKLDDGIASSGRFRVHQAFANTCMRDGNWDLLSENANCAGVLRE